MQRETLFRRKLQQRHLTVYEAFVAQFQRAARELADREGDPRLGSLTVSPRQFDRWMGGELRGLPHPGACRVLEQGGCKFRDRVDRPCPAGVEVAAAQARDR